MSRPINRRKVISGPGASRHRVLVGHLNIKDKIRRAQHVSRVHVHPNMSLESEPWSFDMALIRAAAPLQFTTKVSPICLPGPDTKELFQQASQ